MNGNRKRNEKQNETKGISDTLGNSSHVLDLKWDKSSDRLIVSRGSRRNLQTSLTQSSVISLVASVVDPLYPLVLVAPFTNKARLLLKEVQRLSSEEWDIEFPEDIAGKIHYDAKQEHWFFQELRKIGFCDYQNVF